MRESARPLALRRFPQLVVLVLALTAMLGSIAAVPGSASTAGTSIPLVPGIQDFCPNGAYCATSAMLPLTGAGLNARAYIYFHNHDARSYTIDGLRVVNSDPNQTCSVDWELDAVPGGYVWSPLPDVPLPCNAGIFNYPVNIGLYHDYFDGTTVNYGIVYVTVFNGEWGDGDAVSHSLSTNDFGPDSAHPCMFWKKPNRPRCGDF
jgi:hypothetical protein